VVINLQYAESLQAGVLAYRSLGKGRITAAEPPRILSGFPDQLKILKWKNQREKILTNSKLRSIIFCMI